MQQFRHLRDCVADATAHAQSVNHAIRRIWNNESNFLIIWRHKWRLQSQYKVTFCLIHEASRLQDVLGSGVTASPSLTTVLHGSTPTTPPPLHKTPLYPLVTRLGGSHNRSWRREIIIIIITNSVAWVRERTIATERPPLIGEVSSNFSG
jgi:hypothetical protein